MWQRVIDIINDVSTYADLSPDLQTRRQINQALAHRRSLSVDEWFESFWHPRGISQAVATFVYTHLEKYSGLSVAKVIPSDRLEHDLKLTMICWFDWHSRLCEDFLLCFGVDISDRLDLRDFCTIEELVIFLNYQILAPA